MDTQAIDARFEVVARALLEGVNAAAVPAVLSLNDARGHVSTAQATVSASPSEGWDRLLSRFTTQAEVIESAPVDTLGQFDEQADRFAHGLLTAAAAFLAAEANDLEDRIALLPADRRRAETCAHLEAIARKVRDTAGALITRVERGTWRELLESDPPTGTQHELAYSTLMADETRQQGECPYPGLTAFTEEQAPWFCGRDQLTRDLLARLDERLVMGGVQLVMAPSGAGKSSLLHAGLLPKLAQDALPGSSRWPRLVFTPTADPLTSLATQIAELTGGNPETLAAGLAIDPQPFEATLRRYIDGEGAGARLLVVVDRFEELFTLCTDGQQRRAFIELLSRLSSLRSDSATDVRTLALVVVAVRSDFYGACADDPDLCTALQDNPLVVRPMTDAEAREAILHPAGEAGLDVEAGLVELLLRDLGATTAEPGAPSYQAGRLPLLAHALRATWQQREGDTLTVAGYQSTGGIHRAVATSADRVFTGLDPAGQQVARTLFLRLIKIGDGTEDTRRRLARADLLRGLDPDSVGPALDAFTQGRLLTQERDTVEITHEALLRTWPRLRQWINTDRAGNLMRQELDEAAAAWKQDRRDTARLYRGSLLESARTVANSESIADDLSPATSTFLAASATQERRAVKLRRAVIAVLSVLTLATSVTTVYALHQKVVVRFATQKEKDFDDIVADAEKLRSTNLFLAAQLDVAAYQMSKDPDLRTTLIADPSSTLIADLSTALLTAGNTVLPTVLNGHSGIVTSVAFSPNRQTLATASLDRTVRLWNVADPTHPTPLGTPLTDHTGGVTAVAFSPNGHTLATASLDRTVRLWN
ncbi:MAG: WD40 repeat domain-containing protein, partial [Pseudonocardiaceae bacterium]